jgi:hypothetical protein
MSSWIGCFEDADGKRASVPLSHSIYGILLSTPLKNFKEEKDAEEKKQTGCNSLSLIA